MEQDETSEFTPQASRPYLPEYGLLDADQGQGLFPWGWAQARLEQAYNYWIATTRPDGRPHITAVWGVWFDNAFYFSTGRLTRKARNLAQNANCVVSTENAAEAVIVEGSAQLVSDAKTLKQLDPLYHGKYQSDLPLDGNIYVVRPKVAFGFVDDVAEFSSTATRWRF